MSVQLMAVFAIVIVVGIILYLRFFKKTRITSVSATVEVEVESIHDETIVTKEELMNDVLNFNQYLRCSSMERYLVVTVETILDLLVDSLPVMNKNYPEMSFTQGLNNVFHKRLPDYVELFVESSKDQQEVATPALQAFLQKALDIAQKAKSMADEDRAEDLEAMGLYIETEIKAL